MQEKIVLTIELPITGRPERVAVRGPLYQRDLCLRILKEATEIVKGVAQPMANAILTPEPANLQGAKIL